MRGIDWVWSGVDLGLWYLFIYYWLYTLENEVELARAAVVLLVLLVAAVVACPWFRRTEAWRRLRNGESE